MTAIPLCTVRLSPLATSLSLVLSIILLQFKAVPCYEYVSNFHTEPLSFHNSHNPNSHNPNSDSERKSGLSFELTHTFNANVLKRMGLKGTDLELHALLGLRDMHRHGNAFGRTWMENNRRKLTSEEVEVYKKFPEIVRRELSMAGTSGVTSNFPLQGTVFPNGLYATSVALGTPEQTFNVVIDTGSVLTWVNCQPCESCIVSSQQQLSPPFDKSLSATSSVLACTAPECSMPDVSTTGRLGSGCETLNGGNCSYTVGYADGSSTTGVIIRDRFWLTLANTSERVSVEALFGCGISQQGRVLTSPGWTVWDAIDGLMGLGKSDSTFTNFIVQSTTLGIRNVFTICLRTGFGGGLLAFGDKHVPDNAIYTDLVEPVVNFTRVFYHVNLVRIFVGGRAPSVSTNLFGNMTTGNTVFDSGTTYTSMPTAMQLAIMNMIKLKVGLTPSEDNAPRGQAKAGYLCYMETPGMTVESIALRMPTISLQFEGSGAFMNIPPDAYTFIADGSSREICTRIIPWDPLPGIQLLIGDIWMRNMAFVHDLDNQRFGWAPSTCSIL